MAINLQPYKFTIHSPDYYSFVTATGVEYICYFTPYGEYFKNYPAAISSKFYSFNLELADKKNKPKGVDKRIADTVITIVGDYLASKTNAVVYVCDNSDGRQAARARKFLSWFDYFDHPSNKIVKVTSNFTVGGLFIYSSLLIHKKNKRFNDMVLAYLELTKDEEK
jgi:hypothetical protein